MLSLTLSRPAPLKTFPSHAIPWERVEGLVGRALAEGNGAYSTDDIRDLLERAEAQLWVWEDFEACMVTSIREYPQMKVCLLWLCAGEGLKDWKWAISEIEKWAVSIGCDRIEVTGRRGWVRVLNWPETSVTAGKELCQQE